MTLEELLEHEEKESKATWNGKPTLCAEYHRQLADWLKELKQLREQVSSSEIPNKSEILTGWIPVNQPPKASGRYLVTTRFLKHSQIEMVDYATDLHKVAEYDFPKHEAGWYRYDSEYGYYAIDNVIAWMPLPEPYKAESEEE